MRVVGNKYVFEEFKRHQKAASSYVGPFLQEWSKYAIELEAQIVLDSKVVGKNLDDPDVLSEEQNRQLLGLKEAAEGKVPVPERLLKKKKGSGK